MLPMLKVEHTDLECPICFNYLTRPIFLCPTGHSVCSNCRSRLTKCFCQEEYGQTRNYALENITDKIRLKCKNAACYETIPISEHQRHMVECIFNTVDCKAVNCLWAGNSFSIGEHILHQHTQCLVQNDEILKSHQLSQVFLDIGKHIFLVRRYITEGEGESLVIWTAQATVPIEKTAVYTLFVKITAADGSLYTIKQPCSLDPTVGENELKNKSFLVMKRSKTKGCIFRLSISFKPNK